MNFIISITRQGQLTIPTEVRQKLGIEGQIKAQLEIVGNTFVVKPMANFWSLGSSLASGVMLSDEELKKAREEFSKNWAHPPYKENCIL